MNVYGDIWSDNNFSKIKRINEDMSDLRYSRIGPKGLNEVD
ncbi:20053_t:CDS:1, partial [Cetraspora pellucida]